MKQIMKMTVYPFIKLEGFKKILVKKCEVDQLQ